MMMRTMSKLSLSKSMLATSLLLLGASAQALGWVALLKNTPAEVFDDEDLHMFLSAATEALNAEGSASESVSWRNPATGAGGRFQAVGRSTSKEGFSCKRVRFAIYAKHRKEQSTTWTACRDGAGRWRLSQPR